MRSIPTLAFVMGLVACQLCANETAAAAASEGMTVDYVAKRHNGEALAQELHGELAGKRVLLPQSDLAKDDLARMLREFAGQVIDVVAYRTVAPGSETPAPTGRASNSP